MAESIDPAVPELIKAFEGCRLAAYQDGNGV
jgi:GH24 family phage-related lysozyme (muramidase)